MREPEHLAEQVADGKPLATDADDSLRHKFQHLEAIARAFRKTGTERAVDRPRLFEWRHLQS